MRTRAALCWSLVLAGALVGCKEKQQQPESAPATPQARSSKPGERPTLPPQAPNAGVSATDGGSESAPAAQAPVKPIAVADAAAVLPKLEGTQVLGLKQTSDQGQVHGTWCMDGTSADDVARHVGQLLEQTGYTNVSVRGDERKAGVAGDREGIRFSMVVSASAAAVCKAPAHYFASATIYRL